jgi:hypothetical protein
MSEAPRERAAGSPSTQRVNRFPNIFYHTIAVVCVILVAVEVVGYLKGDGVKIAILIGLAILALLAPNIESLTIGKSGIVAALKKGIDENSSKIDDTKSAAREIDAQLDQKITQIFEELRALKQTAPVEGAEGGMAGPDQFLEQRSIINKDDPQKGRFGGNEQFNGRRIGAVIEASSVQSDWSKVSLKVTSLPGFQPRSRERSIFSFMTRFDPTITLFRPLMGKRRLFCGRGEHSPLVPWRTMDRQCWSLI